ncbi:MAG: DUF1642 domain-containing protein [Enterococcus hirae]|nr:DUF1642 domain-containing protein [Enterococcus hirae]
MNKQELIDELARHASCLEDFRGIIGHCDGKYEAYEIAIELAKQLDEPQKPVVPKCFDIDYKKYKYMENNKAEILLTAMGGIYRVSFPNSFRDDLEANAWKTGIKWNKWTKETILWASRNYADFCQAVILGEYEVEKKPLYEVIIGNLFLVKKFNNRNDSCFVNKFELCWWEKSAYQLTEPEIKAIDERYWPFAVPVEEG